MTPHPSRPVLESLRGSQMVMAVHFDPATAPSARAVQRWSEQLSGAGTEKGTSIPWAEVEPTRFARAWPRLPHQGFPSYEESWPQFASEFERFQRALVADSEAEPVVDECELSYLNAVTPEDEWSGRSMLERLVVEWLTHNAYDGLLPPPEQVVTDTRFRIRDRSGRSGGHLSVAVHSLPGEGPTPMTAVTLSARGHVRGEGLDGAQAFFDTAFDWIVRGFASLASPFDHKHPDDHG